MNPFATPARVLVWPAPTDMRAGIGSLSAKVAASGADPADGSLYVFVSRDCTKLKMLRLGEGGWCLWYCRLCSGAFRWRHGRAGAALEIEPRQLGWLLECMETEQPKAARRPRATRVI